MSSQINLKNGQIARKAMHPIAINTPLMASAVLSQLGENNVYLKPEMLQPTGSFKVRGAVNKIAKIAVEKKYRGVVAVSTGNHGCAVAYAAKKQGLKAFVCLSKNVPQNKINNIKRYGAELIIEGNSQNDAEEVAKKIVREQKLAFVHPFDDPDIICGQGTIALELFEALPKIGTIVVPLSGGGLIAGIAAFAKQISVDVKVIGVSMEKGAAMYESLQAGKPITVSEYGSSLADSLQGGIGLENQWTFNLVKQYVDDIVLVSEESILNAMRFMLHEHKFLLEGSAVVGIAAFLKNQLPPLKRPVVFVLTGQNVSTKILRQLL